MATKKRATKAAGALTAPAKPQCGLVMPISLIDGCDEEHWEDVRNILSDAVSNAGFEPDLVSNADEVGIIQGRIIQNLYNNPMVVCDVSAKNPNVMFELGIRLAFDKPTVIVKDDKTSYSFDTAPIEHLSYPRDLRFATINEFKRALSEKIKATYEKATTIKNYSTFLKHFGQFRVAELGEKQLSTSADVASELTAIREALLELQSETRRSRTLAARASEVLHGISRDDLVRQIESVAQRAFGGKPTRGALRDPDFKEYVKRNVRRNMPFERHFTSVEAFGNAFDDAWGCYKKSLLAPRPSQR